MFELTQDEFELLRCKNCTSKDKETRGGTRYMPFVFTEQGVAMLSGVLKSDNAIEVNIRIMRAFIAMRSFLISNAHMFQRLETIEHHQLLMQKHLSEHDRKIDEILTRLEDKEQEPIEGFFFEGQIFDAYTLISDIVYGIMSDIDYLYQVFPTLPLWLTKTPEEHYAMIEEQYRDKVIGRMMIKETNDVLTTFLDGFHLKSTAHANQIIAGWKSESDRRGKQYESLTQIVADDSAYVCKSVDDLNDHYRKAVQLETLKTRRSGLFVLGRHIFPLWFMVFISAMLLLCTFLASTFAVRTYETNIRLQQELLHWISTPKPPTHR